MTNANQLRRKNALVRSGSKVQGRGGVEATNHHSQSSTAKAKAHKETPRKAGLTLLEEVQRRTIIQVLQATGGNKRNAARRLGVGRQTLYNKIEAFGIEA